MQQVDRYSITDADMKPFCNDELSTILPYLKSGFRLGKYVNYDTLHTSMENKSLPAPFLHCRKHRVRQTETVTKIVEKTAKPPSAKHSDIRYPRRVQASYPNVDSIKMGEVPFLYGCLDFADMAANVLKAEEDSTVVMAL